MKTQSDTNPDSRQQTQNSLYQSLISNDQIPNKDGSLEPAIKNISLPQQNSKQNDTDNPKHNQIKRKYQNGENVLESSNFFSTLFFSYIDRFLQFGNVFDLTKQNVPILSPDQNPKIEFDRFYNIFKAQGHQPIDQEQQSEQARKKKQGTRLAKSIMKAYRKDFLIIFLQLIVFIGSTMVTPVLTDLIIGYVEAEWEVRQTGRGVFLFMTVLILSLIKIISQSHVFYRFGVVGFNLSNTLSLMLYDKALKHPVLWLKKYSVSEIVNYSQVDAQRMTYMGFQLSTILFTPLQVFIGIWLMYSFIGVSFLSGLGIMIVSIILTFFFMKFSIKANEELLKAKDQRMKKSEQTLNLIRFIKVNALEKFFFRKLNQRREIELKLNLRKNIYEILTIFLYWLASPMILSITFATFVWLGNEMTATQAFTTIMLFRILQFPIRQLPTAISELIQIWTSVKRIEKFLVSEEIEIDNIRVSDASAPFAIKISNGSYEWGKEEEKQEDKKKRQQKEKQRKDKKQFKIDSNTTKNKIKESQQSDTKELLRDPQQENQLILNEDQSIDLSKSANEINQEEQASQTMTKSLLKKQSKTEGKEQGSKQKKKVQFIKALKQVDLQIKSGSFTMIIGDIGSGKSSILFAILNQMKPSNSQSLVQVNGQIAYVPQKPWIMSDSLKNNITFSLPFDRERFDLALRCSSMQSDIKLLVDGENTDIGEKGTNLSGGQKARIGLARAIYSDRDIYLLDDIISAVDVHVADFIMKETILKQLKGKTIVMPTHAIKFAEYADHIIVLKKGRVIASGPYQVVREHPQFEEIFIQEQQHSQERKDSENDEQAVLDELKKVKSAQKEITLTRNEAGLEKIVKELIMPEDQKKGSISKETYLQYLNLNGGSKFVFAVVICMIAWLSLSTMANIWMEKWCQDPSNGQYYLYLFLSFSISSSIFMVIRAYTLVIGGVRCGGRAHKKMAKALLYAPLNEFYNRVPLGRIVNRMTKDLRELDQAIGYCVGNFLVSAFSLTGTLVICLYASTPFVVLPLIFVAFVCNILRKYYMKTQRDCVRLQNVTSSPIVSGFLSTVNGLATIRAYNLENEFMRRQIQKVEQNKRLRIAREALESWFCQRLSVITFLVNMSAIAFCMFGKNGNPALAGLLLTYALGLSDDIIDTMFSFTYLESKMVSIERICSFMKIEPETGYAEYTKKWRTRQEGYTQIIQKGSIQFKDVQARYRTNLPLVLKKINLEISAGQKIGVVGRTGAGKSTVVACLLRILDPSTGSILIDGQDITSYFLKDLRYSITMIDQEPTLINASFRQNLDPSDKYDDSELERVLKECNLWNIVIQKGGLQSNVSNDSLSVGEKQLMCICRAFLKESKIVLVDEATANIDQKNDAIIQQVISTKFRESTVLTIAHRLSTLANSDRILVLGQGEVLELGTPQQLLKKPNGVYRAMCSKGSLGTGTSEFLQ